MKLIDITVYRIALWGEECKKRVGFVGGYLSGRAHKLFKVTYGERGNIKKEKMDESGVKRRNGWML